MLIFMRLVLGHKCLSESGLGLGLGILKDNMRVIRCFKMILYESYWIK
jgi:hypothetical protein